MRLLDWLLDLIYPPKCVFCGRLLHGGEIDLCGKCRHSLPDFDGSVKRGKFYRQCWPVYTYEGAVVESIHRFKFSGMQQYAAAYGRLIAAMLLRCRVEFDVLTWVPISAKRCRKRGYDQSWLIAKAVAGELKVPCVRTLEKFRDNKPQSRQKDAASRHSNVLNVYRSVHPEHFAGKRVLLIDDIITTGATLTECSKILKIAGAGEVECAVLAATMLREKERNSR